VYLVLGKVVTINVFFLFYHRSASPGSATPHASSPLASLCKSNCVRPPHPKQAVRKLLPVINESLLFRFKALKCFLFCLFTLKLNCRTLLQTTGYSSEIRAKPSCYTYNSHRALQLIETGFFNKSNKNSEASQDIMLCPSNLDSLINLQLRKLNLPSRLFQRHA